eukprot:TRINITY_DN287_c0_g1_i2.p1 TRINITY_DN287_c0_g1~~TRINITY_DN287_c0_g1_i2.p1  ORF type:complete len:632 (+),score=147.59 TRINITY_DN287_c0_g1_i2:45-1898(+)
MISKLLLLLCTSGLASVNGGKIKHVVVLMEENRSFDHMMGWRKGVNGLKGDEYNLVDTKDPNSKKVYVSKNATQVSWCDPDHSTGGTTNKIFTKREVEKGNFTTATMGGFAEGQSGQASSNYCQVMDMQTPDRVPIMTALADEFILMDRFFASHPGPTWPNRMYMLAATTAGSTETGTWYHNEKGLLFPQKTFFDQLTAEGHTWRNYYNDTPWELFMETIAHNPNNTQSMEQFWTDCREGTLPTYSWINPSSGINMTLNVGSNDQHPDHDVAAGERYYKDIYEALRSSPLWEETLFIITYDEHGGYYDHVPTPLNVPVPEDGEESYPDKNFKFDRLGIRLPTLLISPWLPKGGLVSAPPSAQKPFNNSEYELTSIMATTRKLLGMDSTPLTKRDAWAATFEHVFDTLDSPRTDCPLHLPEPIPPQKGALEIEAELEPNSLQEHILTVHSHMAGVDYPSHIKKQKHVSEWLTKHYAIHRNYQTTSYPVEVGVYGNNGWLTNMTSNTISTKLSSVEYCLDGGSMAVGNYIRVTPCGDLSSQKWVHEKDATIRPAANSNLCLDQIKASPSQWTPTVKTRLAVCDGSVTQHYANHRSAPGNPGNGGYGFGNSNLFVNTTSL